MSEQAIETENEIITTELTSEEMDGETIVVPAEDVEEEVEIIVEGEEKPASKSSL